MDLLAVREGKLGLEGRHIEVQVSANPISYISPLTTTQAKALKKSRTSAWARPKKVLETAVSAWVEKKFLDPKKVKARNRAWRGLSWSYELVHGSVRHPEELALIESHGIKTVSFHLVLASLCNGKAIAHKGGAGTDIADILAYYVTCGLTFRSRGTAIPSAAAINALSRVLPDLSHCGQCGELLTTNETQ